jgi:hypothetical protein
LSQLPVGATLAFPEGAIARLDGLAASDTRVITIARPGRLEVEARWTEPEPGCESTRFRATIDAIAAPPTDPASAPDAIPFDDPRLTAWAAGWTAPAWGTDLAPEWQDLTRALGPATGLWDDAVSLGNGGAITLIFETPVADHAGPDLAVFENGFSEQFLELAWVEVSSDGLHFARFASLSTQDEGISAYGTLDPREVMGVAGRFRGGYGTTFDLATLAATEAVLTGRVDLSAITHVRVVDIIGDGNSADSFGHPIFDPTPTYASAGFDLEAIGAITSERPSPP